jgi:anhydro-N-acetylmuramic acid kinase
MSNRFFNKPSYVIGVMSGTSLDGMDLCYASFLYQNKWTFEIISTATIPYSKAWKEKLQSAHQISDEDLLLLDIEYSTYTRKCITDFIARNNIQNLDLIASHGHTVFHEPEKGITFQLGNLMNYDDAMEVPFVCDFRVQDVQLGGQGAPLVPIGDRLLFNEYTHCINIGGFANISFEEEDLRKAYDISPANKVLNFYAEKLGFDFDKGGAIAKKNEVHAPLVEALNQVPFYTKTAPKSLGIEWLEASFYPVVEGFAISTEEKMASLTAHIAQQIANCIPDEASVLITGGGAFNTHLVESIKRESNANINIPTLEIVNYKEALIFAFLGLLRIHNQVNVLSSVTGASKDHSSGSIY